MIERLCVIGVGLIGGSIACSARREGICREIVGIDADKANLRRALDLGVIDAAFTDAAEGAIGADWVMIATPVGAFESVFEALRPVWSERAVYSDAGSTKQSVIEAARTVFGKVPPNFVPGHPIAGAERSGVEAATDDLYRGKRVILTPLSTTSPLALKRVEAFWEAIGAKVSKMDPAHHDEVLAATSHLPHVLAYALVHMLGRKNEQQEIFQYAAGGFRDFTRIASSDPKMWLDICLANQEQIAPLIAQLCDELNSVKGMLDNRDADDLFEFFVGAHNARQRFLDQLENDTMLKPTVNFRVEPGGSLRGEARVPGDKSISHRSIMLGSIAEGVTHVTGFLEAEDCLATMNAFRAMGVKIEGPEAGRVIIHGVGLNGLKESQAPLYLGNSGTSMRLLSGLLAGQDFDTVLTGDASLTRRPMKRVTEPLREMGARIETSETGTAPLKIKGRARLHGIRYDMPVASAQVKSCLLLAGLYAEGKTCVREPAPTRDHTERMLAGFGYPIDYEDGQICIRSGGTLKATDIDVPSDISSAAFFMVGAAIAADADLTLLHVGVNPTRIGVIDILRLMRAKVEICNERVVGGEPVADIRVRSSALRGIQIPEHLVPLAIDEFPVLFVAAACAEGETRLTGAEELRVKESDRIQVMADGLTALGIDAQPTPDGMIIQGGRLSGGSVDSHGDHRIAMAFSIAALRASGPITISDCENVNTSFPNFVELAQGLGLNIAVHGGS